MGIINAERQISREDVRYLAPAAFAERPHARVSDKFVFVSSVEVMDRLDAAGFDVVDARQSNPRTSDRHGYASHMLVFRPRGEAGFVSRHGGLAPMAAFMNGADGSGSVRVLSGLWRAFCANGLMVGGGGNSTARVIHKGQSVEAAVTAAIESLIENQPKLIERVDRWAGVNLTDSDSEEYAKRVHAMRFPNQTTLAARSISPADMLGDRRVINEAQTLWGVFNGLQGAITKGGLSGTGTGRHGRARGVSTKLVSNHRQLVDLNTKLWGLTENFYGELTGNRPEANDVLDGIEYRVNLPAVI